MEVPSPWPLSRALSMSKVNQAAEQHACVCAMTTVVAQLPDYAINLWSYQHCGRQLRESMQRHEDASALE